MKNNLIISLIAAGLLFGQTSDQVKKANDVIKSTGMSEAQAKATAKAQGYTDQQIEAVVVLAPPDGAFGAVDDCGQSLDDPMRQAARRPR